jgi:hypothetical protein
MPKPVKPPPKRNPIALIALSYLSAVSSPWAQESTTATPLNTYWVSAVMIENYGSLVSADGSKGACEETVQRSFHMMRTKFPTAKVLSGYCYRVLRDDSEMVVDNGR